MRAPRPSGDRRPKQRGDSRDPGTPGERRPCLSTALDTEMAKQVGAGEGAELQGSAALPRPSEQSWARAGAPEPASARLQISMRPSEPACGQDPLGEVGRPLLGAVRESQSNGNLNQSSLGDKPISVPFASIAKHQNSQSNAQKGQSLQRNLPHQLKPSWNAQWELSRGASVRSIGGHASLQAPLA